MWSSKALLKQHIFKNRPFLRAITVAAIVLLSAVLFACGGSDDSDSDSGGTTSNDFTAVFTDGIRDLTPNLETSAVTAWDGWCADGASGHEYNLFAKLFGDPEQAGWESIYGPVEQVETVLTILENYDEQLSENGEYEIEPGDDNTYTAVVSDMSDDFTVPYFSTTQSGLTKQVVITAADNSWKMMVAYDMEGDDKAMVAHTVHANSEESSTEYMVFRANFNETSQVLLIWVAAADDSTDSFKIAFIWKGNLDDETFALSQYTNAAKSDLDSDGTYETDGFWKVMGGGSLDSQMAFRANTADSASDDYFVVVSMDDITSGTAPTGYPADASTIDSATSAVQAYIDESEDSCLGYLSGFPEVTDLNDWDY